MGENAKFVSDCKPLKQEGKSINQQNWIHLGIAEELKFGPCKLWWTIGQFGEQRRTFFDRGKEKVGRGWLEWMKAHWRILRIGGGVGSASWANLWEFITSWAVAGQGEKSSFSLLGCVKLSCMLQQTVHVWVYHSFLTSF